MSEDVLLFEASDGVATLALNRPQVRNAIDDRVGQRLLEAILSLEKDESIGVVIVTGKGEAFSAGADIRGLREKTWAHRLAQGLQETLWRLEGLPKPVIAAVNGYALGGGLELALACDIRIASERARFGFPEANLGIIPGAGGTQRLAHLVGIGKAKEMIFTGAIIEAEEARAIGLANQVVPHEELLSKAHAMAETILAKGPLAVRLAKAAINVSYRGDLASGLAFEKMAQTFLFTTEDRIEGMTAFFEKRKPEFRGR